MILWTQSLLFLVLLSMRIVGEELVENPRNLKTYVDRTEEIKIRCQQIELDDETQSYFDCVNFVPRPIQELQKPMEEKVKCHPVTLEDGRSHFVCPSVSVPSNPTVPKEKVKCRQIENIDGSLSFDCGIRRAHAQNKQKVQMPCAQVRGQDGNLRFDCGNTLTEKPADSTTTHQHQEPCKEIWRENESLRIECFGYSFTIKEPTKPRVQDPNQGKFPTHSSEFKQQNSASAMFPSLSFASILMISATKINQMC